MHALTSDLHFFPTDLGLGPTERIQCGTEGSMCTVCVSIHLLEFTIELLDGTQAQDQKRYYGVRHDGVEEVIKHIGTLQQTNLNLTRKK